MSTEMEVSKETGCARFVTAAKRFGGWRNGPLRRTGNTYEED